MLPGLVVQLAREAAALVLLGGQQLPAKGIALRRGTQSQGVVLRQATRGEVARDDGEAGERAIGIAHRGHQLVREEPLAVLAQAPPDALGATGRRRGLQVARRFARHARRLWMNDGAIPAEDLIQWQGFVERQWEALELFSKAEMSSSPRSPVT